MRRAADAPSRGEKDLARQEPKRRRAHSQREAHQATTTHSQQHHAATRGHTRARTRPPGRLHTTKRKQNTPTRITPRQQRYRQHDSRQQTQDSVEHEYANTTPLLTRPRRSVLHVDRGDARRDDPDRLASCGVSAIISAAGSTSAGSQPRSTAIRMMPQASCRFRVRPKSRWRAAFQTICAIRRRIRYQGQMAVYVKPRGPFGKGYMALIKPFRYWIVYPALMRQIERAWNARMASPSPLPAERDR